jgi:hypothetical protein
MLKDQGILYEALPIMPSGCPCCYPTMLLVTLLALSLIVQLTTSIIKHFLPSKVLKWISYFIHGVIIVIAVTFGILMASAEVRDFVFFKFAMSVLLVDKPMDAIRCQQFSGVSGRVLEIGVGPGTNFRCWSNNKGAIYDTREDVAKYAH